MLSVLRADVKEVTPGTMVERQFNTPVSPDSLMAMVIYHIITEMSWPAPPATRPAADACQLLEVTGGLSTRQGLAVPPYISDPGALQVHRMNKWEISAPADAGVGAAAGGDPTILHVPIPEGLLIADSTLSLYIIGTTYNTSGAMFRCMILYKLEKVSGAEYMAALSVVNG